ncbi:MAG: hypothetical protein A2Z99_13325 [Treponema sp. GWB1_62_6]|nr:MAG: hypothetical protein A2001_19805 [Treponema sp. GWC1_61_84]OHE69992.1 MAG: hypothetical protein A2Z99_13325 [Treponema sp. GWB1_62_6]HCM25816.1 hypothetical protein [Treponema sp.]
MVPENGQELYHEIFGSILDRREMTPYLLRGCDGYATALCRASRMMANRGFDSIGGELLPGEKERAHEYVIHATRYFASSLFPFVESQLRALAALDSELRPAYEAALVSISAIRGILADPEYAALVAEDPRHLFLLVSSGKYPDLFRGKPGKEVEATSGRRAAACATLKMCRLIKAVEEDSQDINDFARLGLFLEARGRSLADLFDYDWENPESIPDDECAQRAFVKLSAFFHKLKESIAYDPGRSCLVFDSGDGVRVDVAELKARLKSPESMFAKLGKDTSEEIQHIRDVLAVTFLLREREDALALFHALQKRGVILQENVVSASITQTLFDNPHDMEEATLRLMRALARGALSDIEPDREEAAANAADFFRALDINAVRNPHSADQHRKFQCKINFSLPVHRDASTRRILVPGTAAYSYRDRIDVATERHTLPVELRISDVRSWELSEKRGEAHHDAYKFRQLTALMNRLFDPLFRFPPEEFGRLRADQARLFV